MFNYRIIHIRRISSIPYPTPHSQIIEFGLSTSTRIFKTLIRILKIQIRNGPERRIIHTTFTAGVCTHAGPV